MYNTFKYDRTNFVPQKFESDGVVTIRGEKIPYHTVSEDNVFYDKDGKPIASIFSYSYFRSDVEDTTNRPVVFAYNGGPGSSSMYVHVGFFGPNRVKYKDDCDTEISVPPYEVINNDECLLDIADLVLIDPVGTGYGLLLNEDSAKEFFGIEEDAEALLYFVEMWLRRYNRFLSPKFLAGESYGCTRNAIAAGIAGNGFGRQRGFGVKFDGLINIGNTITVGKYFNKEVPVENSVLLFPTYAAINWYHNHPSKQTVAEFVEEAKKWADEKYLLALYKGEALSEREKDAVIKKLVYYTGVSKEYLVKHALRIDEEGFRKQVIRDKGLVASRYDGRMTRKALEPFADEEKFYADATAQKYDGLFYNALNGVVLPSLGIKMDRQYMTFRNFWGDGTFKWNYEEKGGVTGERLREAMSCMKGMKVFFANGWYDDCTEIGFIYYLLDHQGLDKSRIYLKAYESGHMIYISEKNTRELSKDIHSFILGKDPTK